MGADAAFIALHNGTNVSIMLARKLHVISDGYVKAAGKLRKSFGLNVAYDLGDGLQFRVNDKDDGNSPPTIEFIATVAQDKSEALGRIAGLFREIGISDDKIIGDIGDAVTKGEGLMR